MEIRFETSLNKPWSSPPRFQIHSYVQASLFPAFPQFKFPSWYRMLHIHQGVCKLNYLIGYNWSNHHRNAASRYRRIWPPRSTTRILENWGIRMGGRGLEKRAGRTEPPQQLLHGPLDARTGLPFTMQQGASISPSLVTRCLFFLSGYFSKVNSSQVNSRFHETLPAIWTMSLTKTFLLSNSWNKEEAKTPGVWAGTEESLPWAQGWAALKISGAAQLVNHPANRAKS